MKSMSMVVRLSDAPETLDEARKVIDKQEADYRRNLEKLTELRKTLREYLALSSIDGRAERQPLREKLKALCG